MRSSVIPKPQPKIIEICTKGPSINDVTNLEGRRGAKLTIWGKMRGIGVKENPISSIQDFFSFLFYYLRTKLWYDFLF